MKQVSGGKTPFATGDAVNGGWATTNLSLYSGSAVGYLASIINKTNVDGILQIDLNKTDSEVKTLIRLIYITIPRQLLNLSILNFLQEFTISTMPFRKPF